MVPERLINEVRKTFSLGLPMVLTMVGWMIMGIVDTFVVGNVSSDELAGVGAANGLFWPIVTVCMALTYGLDALVSWAYGAGEYAKCDKSLGQALIVATVVSLIITPLLVFLADYYHLTGASPDVVKSAVPYLKSISLSLPFVLFYAVLQRYWQAFFIATPVTVITLLANLMHYGMDVLFVTGKFGVPALGAVGVGYATFVCRGLMLIALALVSWHYFKKRVDDPDPKKRFSCKNLFSFDREIMRSLLGMGVPSAGQVGLEVSSFAIATTVIAGLGAIPSAAHQIVLTIISFTYMFPQGLSVAASIRVGSLIGAGDVRQATRAGWVGIGMSSSFMIVFVALFVFLPRPLIALFTYDLSVIDIAVSILFVAAIFQIFDAVQVTAAGTLRGTGNTKLSFYSNLVGHYCVGLPIALTLCYRYGLGARGVWIGLATGLMTTAVTIFVAWRLTCKKLIAES